MGTVTKRKRVRIDEDDLREATLDHLELSPHVRERLDGIPDRSDVRVEVETCLNEEVAYATSAFTPWRDIGGCTTCTYLGGLDHNHGMGRKVAQRVGVDTSGRVKVRRVDGDWWLYWSEPSEGTSSALRWAAAGVGAGLLAAAAWYVTFWGI